MSISPCLRVCVNSVDWCIEVTVHLPADDAVARPLRPDLPNSGVNAFGADSPAAGGEGRAPAATTAQAQCCQVGADEGVVVEMVWREGADDEC